jgi:dimethylamine/trimethylamine dehydrogenase
MVIGAGPAGLEAARALGQRGYEVALLEVRKELGGRVLRESALPGLNEWRRVVDWRLTQIGKMKNISVYPSSPMISTEIIESGAQNIILATGAAWRRDGLGRTLSKPIRGCELKNVFSLDDLMDGKLPLGKVILYDDDHYYMGGVLAELLASQGCEVTLVTPAPLVSYWSQYTLEQERIQRKLLKLGVKIHVQHVLDSISADSVRISSTITGASTELEKDAVVLVTDRISNDSLYAQLKPALDEGRLHSLRLIGDAEAPNIIAQAVFSGHLAAREFDETLLDGTPFKIERTNLL